MPPRAPRARSQVDPLAYGLFALCLFYAAYTLAIALSPRVAIFAMARAQLADDDFVRWAVFAPAPFMYNFENRVLVSPAPLATRELEARPAADWLFLNHYPARALTYFDLRSRLFARPSRSYVYLESRYREQRLVTSYRVVYTSAGGRGRGSIERWRAPLRPGTSSGARATR